MKTGRNDPCPCGSGKKYKHCCYEKDSAKHETEVTTVAADDRSEDEDTVEESSRHEHHMHPKDRSRFQGEVRGGAAAFRPRNNRPSQRGS